MKTPISYYGGKQDLIPEILPLIPKHKMYVEPFIGGGAIYWAKKPSEIEVINDLNNDVVNFYRVFKTKFDELHKEINCTLHSRNLYEKADKILYYPDKEYSDVEKAWAFWTKCNMSFGRSLRVKCGWAFDNFGVQENFMFNLKTIISKDYEKRINLTQIDCSDAIKVIKQRDSENTFFYLDPPYYNSDISAYKGYTIDNFKELLETCENIKGKFLLSSYLSDLLTEFRIRNNWNKKDIVKMLKVSGKHIDKNRIKTECLTFNYRNENEPLSLFSNCS